MAIGSDPFFFLPHQFLCMKIEIVPKSAYTARPDFR